MQKFIILFLFLLSFAYSFGKLNSKYSLLKKSKISFVNDGMILQVRCDSDEECTVKLVLTHSGGVLIDLDDGQGYQEIIENEFEYTFPAPGEYLIRIKGEMDYFQYSNQSTAKLLNVQYMNLVTIRSLEESFKDCQYLNNLPALLPSGVLNLKGCFSGCTELEYANITNWQLGNVTDMSYLFYGCVNLRESSIENADLNNVVDMSHMFEGCTNLYQFNIRVTPFNSIKLENLEAMFKGCER